MNFNEHNEFIMQLQVNTAISDTSTQFRVNFIADQNENVYN